MIFTREDIVREARLWLDTPFKHQGRLLGIGVDCLGVLLGVCDQLNIYQEYTDPKDYGRMPSGKLLQTSVEKFLIPVSAINIKMGDVGIFRFQKEPQHIAIFTDIGIIHAYSEVGKCVEHIYSSPWDTRLVQSYSFKELL